jgi:hypothetical protein
MTDSRMPGYSLNPEGVLMEIAKLVRGIPTGADYR